MTDDVSTPEPLPIADPASVSITRYFIRLDDARVVIGAALSNIEQPGMVEVGAEIYESARRRVNAATYDGTALADYSPPPIAPPVPSITARQLRLWLVRNGVPLASIDTAIAALPEPARTEAQIEWQYASQYTRDNPLLDRIGAAIGKTPAEIDAGMREAATI